MMTSVQRGQEYNRSTVFTYPLPTLRPVYTLHTAAEPAVHAAVKTLVSYRNAAKIAFFFAAS